MTSQSTVSNFLPGEIELDNPLDDVNFSQIADSSSRNNVEAQISDTLINIESTPNSSQAVEERKSQEEFSLVAKTAIDLTSRSPRPRKPDLMGRFEGIILPDTLEMGGQGQVQLKIKNRGHAVAAGEITIKLYISTDDVIGKNDDVLATVKRTINLQHSEYATFDIDYNNIPSVAAPGGYKIIAQIDSENTLAESREDNNLVGQWVSATGTDVVIDWHSIALNAIQSEGVAARGIGPTAGSRLLAILSNSIYDTVNSFERTHEPYLIDTTAPSNASKEAAVVGAAYKVLSTFMPEKASFLDQQMNLSLKEIRDKPLAETVGFAFGYNVASQIIAARANDGSDNNTPYTPPDGDYVWHPDPPNFTALGPNWGGVTPFSTEDLLTQFPFVFDGTLNTDLYAQEIEEVRKFGGKENTAVTTLERTAEQTEIAIFWASDRADTYRPYGHLIQLAANVAVNEGNTLAENARLFAALDTALADVVIVLWNSKYINTQPRPDDVIAGGIALYDKRVDTLHDPDWVPLLPTPPFPDYPSGHSGMGGVFGGVMTHFYGENYEFDAVSQELPNVVRHFESFDAAAEEDAISRVYGGVHVREATQDALNVGLEIGEFVAETLYQPVI